MTLVDSILEAYSFEDARSQVPKDITDAFSRAGKAIPKDVRRYLNSIPHTQIVEQFEADVRSLSEAIQTNCGDRFLSEIVNIFVEKRNPELAAVREGEITGTIVRFPRNIS